MLNVSWPYVDYVWCLWNLVNLFWMLMAYMPGQLDYWMTFRQFMVCSNGSYVFICVTVYGLWHFMVSSNRSYVFICVTFYGLWQLGHMVYGNGSVWLYLGQLCISVGSLWLQLCISTEHKTPPIFEYIFWPILYYIEQHK